MSKAIYAFSGDPITYGHLDIIKRACRVFEEVVVAIGVNPDKSYMFSLDERTLMAKKALKNVPGVRVVSFRGLLVDYAFEHNIPVIIKGLRNSKDFDYELTLHQMTKSQQQEIDTFFLPAKQDLAHISSSSAKALQLEQGLIHEYVHLYVKECLEAKISGQYIIGITGVIGAGKSYLSKRFEELGRDKYVEVHNIELDHIGHQILNNLSEPLYKKVRQDVFKTFGEDLKLPDGSVDRKKLGEIVFNDKGKLDILNSIINEPMLLRLRRDLYKKRGLILFNAALIAEADLEHLCNNNIILVNADKETQRSRLMGRNLNDEQIQKRLAGQYGFDKKLKKIKDKIAKDGQGEYWVFDNSDGKDQEEFSRLFDKMLHSLDLHGELRFRALYMRIGIGRNFDTDYKALIQAYSRQHRNYYTLSHLLEMVRLVDELGPLLTNRDIVEAAVWYSRIHLDTRNGDSIEQSARRSSVVFEGAGMPAQFCNKVSYYIRCLNHSNMDLKDDAVYMADMDLSVLGGKWEDFKVFEEKLRREYFWMSQEHYTGFRTDFYHGLLKRECIYLSEYFYTRCENRARKNLEHWIRWKNSDTHR